MILSDFRPDILQPGHVTEKHQVGDWPNVAQTLIEIEVIVITMLRPSTYLEHLFVLSGWGYVS